MSYTDKKITQEEINAHHVQGATDYLMGNAQQNKAVFDDLPEFIAGKHNELIDELNSQHGDEIRVAVNEWLAEHPEVTTTVQDNSLTTAKYVDESVTEPKIAAGAVTPTKLDRAYSTPDDLASVNANLTNELNVLDARMDEFASLPEGSTTADAELLDIRVGADGETYQTAGGAVRGQVAALKSDTNRLLHEQFMNTIHGKKGANWFSNGSNCKSYSVSGELFKKDSSGDCVYTADSISITSSGSEWNSFDFCILDDISPGSTLTISGTRNGGTDNAFIVRTFEGMSGEFKLNNANVIAAKQGNNSVTIDITERCSFVHIIFVGSFGSNWPTDSVATFSNVEIRWHRASIANYINTNLLFERSLREKFLDVVHDKKDSHWLGNASNCKSYTVSGESIKKNTNGVCTYIADSVRIVSAGGAYNAVDFYILDDIAPNSTVTVSGSRSGGLNNAIYIRALNGMGDDFKMAEANVISTVYGDNEVVYNVPSDTMFVHIMLIGSRGSTWAEDSVATFSDLTITWKTGVDSAVIADLQGQINENSQKIEDIEELSNIDEYVNVVNQQINRFESKVTELEAIIDDDLSVNDALNPTPIIFDTDFGGDSDDAIAVRVLSYYESIGTVRTIFASMNHREIRCLKGMNALFEYDGTFDLPITMPSGSIEEWTQGYGYTLSLYPHTQNTPYSVRGYKAYRKALSQLTRKCVIVAVGTYKNISDLLNSTADEYSNLTGIQLMQEKVDRLVLMGGAFPNSLDAMGNEGAVVDGVQTPGAEWNFAGDIPATTNVITNCPVPIIFCGWEIGHAIKCGGGISDKLPTDDALIAALRAHGGETEVANGRDGFDPITTAIACVGDARKLGYELIRGTINYDPTTSRNTFTESQNGTHYYVKTKYATDYYKIFMNHILAKDWWGNVNSSKANRMI